MSICAICKNKNFKEELCRRCIRSCDSLPTNFTLKDTLEIEKYLDKIEAENREKEDLDKMICCLKDKNTYLKSELEKYKSDACTEKVIDSTDYKMECKKSQEQLANAIKIIKYLSSLL